MTWIGIDIGGTNTKAVLLAADGVTVVAESSVPTDRRGPRAAVARAADSVRDWLCVDASVVGAGLAIPGHFDDRTGRSRVVPNIPGDWVGFPVRDEISRQLDGLPATLINDARALGLAESRLGAARGHRVVVAIVLGTGIGGAVIIDGEVFGGSTALAGEIGHMVLQPDGPRCGCGNRGCLEALTSSAAVAAEAGAASMFEAMQRAQAGDGQAARALERAGTWLGLGLANASTLLAPDAIVVGGGVSSAGEHLLGPLRDELNARTPLVPPGSCTVRMGELGTISGAIGAALAAPGRN